MRPITQLTGSDLETVLTAIKRVESIRPITSLRICQNGSQVMLKINEGMWSAPLGGENK